MTSFKVETGTDFYVLGGCLGIRSCSGEFFAVTLNVLVILCYGNKNLWFTRVGEGKGKERVGWGWG